MTNVVVTGATSFIGFSFAKACLHNDMKVFAVVRPNSPRLFSLETLRGPNFVVVPCEMADYGSLVDRIPNPIDVFAHFSWTGTRGKDRLDVSSQNQNVIFSHYAYSSAQKMGASTFVDAGSQAEYGLVSGKISEEILCHPNTSYGLAKLAFFKETAALSKRDGIRYLHPRFFSVYGPGDSETAMVMATIQKMRKNEDCFFTEATQEWNYFFVEDLAENLFSLIFKTTSEGAFNFGSEISKPLKEYIIEMKSILHSQSNLNFGAIPYPPTGCVSIVPDIVRLKKVISFVEKFSFSEGILATARSIEHNIVS